MHKAYQDRVRARLPAQLPESNKEMAHEDVAVCENESAEVLDTPPDVSVDGDAEVSVSSALEISEDEDADDSSDGGISISNETKHLMGNDPYEGVCLYEPVRKNGSAPS